MVRRLETSEVRVGLLRLWTGKWSYKKRLARFWRMIAKDRIEGRRVTVR